MFQNDLPYVSEMNEISILEFTINDEKYGINVMKVREIINPIEVTVVPHTHKNVEGIIDLRGEILPVINLEKALKNSSTGNKETDKYIVCEFNQIKMVFRVHAVTQIHRLFWADIEKPSEMYQGFETKLTGVVKQQDDMILLVDLEKIAIDIYPESGISIEHVRSLEKRNRDGKKILLVEDSSLLRKLLTQTLKDAGYEEVTAVENGTIALEYLKEKKEEIHIIVTDIEMPQIDGYQLTKMVKEDKELQHIPVVIFSTLITKEMEKKANESGADAQIGKSNIDKLVQIMDEYI